MMLFLLACTASEPESPHTILRDIAQEHGLPVPEQLDPSYSRIRFSSDRNLSLQERYADIELMFESGLWLEKAADIGAANLTLTQLAIMNYELSSTKIQLNPETSAIVFSCVIDGTKPRKDVLVRRILSLMKDEETMRPRIENALYPN